MRSAVPSIDYRRPLDECQRCMADEEATDRIVGRRTFVFRHFGGPAELQGWQLAGALRWCRPIRRERGRHLRVAKGDPSRQRPGGVHSPSRFNSSKAGIAERRTEVVETEPSLPTTSRQPQRMCRQDNLGDFCRRERDNNAGVLHRCAGCDPNLPRCGGRRHRPSRPRSADRFKE